MRFLTWARALGALALLALAGGAACGSKTGLRLPDVMDVPDVHEACVPGRFALQRRSADIVFVIDRSSSMNWGLEGGRGATPTRWEVLRAVLETALPPYEGSIEMGAAFFPQQTDPNAPIEELCSAAVRVDVPAGPRNAGAILSILRTTEPAGGTPTYEALQVTGRYLATRAARGRARYIVLATDGGPNCNENLDPSTCVCTSVDDRGQPTCPVLPQGQYNCLDDTRTLRAIQQSLASGVPTYVIGIDDPTRPELTEVLNRMAIAGGRPNTMAGSERYYSVRRREDLLRAFDTIQSTIARCAFVTPSRPDDPDAIEIEADGVPVGRDETRRDGWDWTDRDFGEITLFGPTCMRLRATTTLTARVGCRDGG